MGAQNTNRISDSHETRLTPPTNPNKAKERNGIGIGLPVIQICMKTAFSTHRLSKTKFLRFGGVKTQTVDPIAMKHDSHLPHI